MNKSNNENKGYPVTLKEVVQMVVMSTILSIILVFIITMNFQVVIDFFFPVDPFIPFPYNLCGLLVSVLGFALSIWANYGLLYIGKIGLKAREPFHTPSTLVVEGPYRFSRNPIYLGAIMMILGLAILLSSLTLFIITIALFILFRVWFIRWEEKKLEEAFGQDYLEFKRRVRRWL